MRAGQRSRVRVGSENWRSGQVCSGFSCPIASRSRLNAPKSERFCLAHGLHLLYTTPWRAASLLSVGAPDVPCCTGTAGFLPLWRPLTAIGNESPDWAARSQFRGHNFGPDFCPWIFAPDVPRVVQPDWSHRAKVDACHGSQGRVLSGCLVNRRSADRCAGRRVPSTRVRWHPDQDPQHAAGFSFGYSRI